MKAYINYPQPHFTIHWRDDCSEFRKQHKEGQRILAITSEDLGDVLERFIALAVDFGSSRDDNDMWLDITLDSPKQEEAVVHVIQALLAQRYGRLKSASVEHHGC